MLLGNRVDENASNGNRTTKVFDEAHVLIEEENRSNNNKYTFEGVGDRVSERIDFVERDEGGLVVQVVAQSRRSGIPEIGPLRIIRARPERFGELGVSKRELYTGLSDRQEIQWKQALPR